MLNISTNHFLNYVFKNVLTSIRLEAFTAILNVVVNVIATEYGVTARRRRPSSSIITLSGVGKYDTVR